MSDLTKLENSILHKENCTVSNPTCKISSEQAVKFKNFITRVQQIHDSVFELWSIIFPDSAKEEHKLCIAQIYISKFMKECLEKISFDKSKLKTTCKFLQ